MSISRRFAFRAVPKPAWLALEAIVLAIALGFLPELAAARSGARLEPHPGWIAVLILAARYSDRGLFAGLGAAAAAVEAGAVSGGAGLAATWSRLGSTPNLIAFGACLIVSWIAAWHLRRAEDLTERSRALADRAAESDLTLETLRTTIGTLRARVDRTSSSLSFLRDVAGRLEGADPVAAAEAAADLALARTGAHAAAVKIGMGSFQRTLAVRDARGVKMLAPLALEAAGVTVPIRNGEERIGVIALWGIQRAALDDATEHDLAIIAAWCVKPLAAGAWRPEGVA